jgi:DeoR/GlpR family transcriptional regulator of sugar metabolism
MVFLIKELLKAEGKSIDSISVSDLSRRFGISEFSIRKGMRELGKD